MSGNEDELPVDPFGTADDSDGFEESQARDRLREQTLAQAQEQFPFLSEEDVRVREGEEGGQIAEFTPEARRQIERRLAAKQFDEELDEFDVQLSDIVTTDEGLRLREEARLKLLPSRSTPTCRRQTSRSAISSKQTRGSG